MAEQKVIKMVNAITGTLKLFHRADHTLTQTVLQRAPSVRGPFLPLTFA